MRVGTESAKHPSPLRGVIWGGGAGDVRGGLAARLQLSETVAHMARVVRVSVATETSGELLLTDRYCRRSCDRGDRSAAR